MPNSTRPGFSHSRLNRSEVLVGSGSLLLFIGFLMKWMSFQGSIAVGVVSGLGLLVLLAWLGVVVLSVLRSPVLRDTVSSPALPASDAALLTVAGTVELAGLVLFYIHYRGGIGGYHRSTEFGYVLALIGSILTVAAGVVAVRAGHDVFHELGASTAPAAPCTASRTGDWLRVAENERTLRTAGTGTAASRARGTARVGSPASTTSATSAARP